MSINDACSKIYVDDARNEIFNQDINFNNYNSTNIDSITLNTQAVNDNHVITKAYEDQIHKDNERNRRDLGLLLYNEEVDLVKNNQDNDFNDNILIILISVTVNRNPTLNNELTTKRYINDSTGENTLVIFK